MMQNKLAIGITGITGSGTSTAAGILKEQGGFVISADKLAHDAIKIGREAYKKIVEVFGASVLMLDGEINRKALGALVFGDENNKKRALLESIIHPIVLAEVRTLVKSHKNSFVVIDAPLLIESGLYIDCDEVWLITASDSLRITRIVKRDGIDIQAAERRLKSRQEEELAKHATAIIKNNGDYEGFKKQVLKTFEEVKYFV